MLVNSGRSARVSGAMRVNDADGHKRSPLREMKGRDTEEEKENHVQSPHDKSWVAALTQDL